MRVYCILMLGAMILVVSNCTRAKEEDQLPLPDGKFLNQVQMIWETPHLPFAKPLPGGPLRAVFVVPFYLAPREVVEMAQRLELDFEAVTTVERFAVTRATEQDPYVTGVTGTSLAEKTKQLRAALATDPEVIVLGNFKFEALPKDLQQDLIARVRDGAGLVLMYDYGLPGWVQQNLQEVTGEEPWEYVKDAFPLPDLCYYSQQHWRWPAQPEQVRFYRLGQGRVGTVDFGKPPGQLDHPNSGGTALTAPQPFQYRHLTTYRYHLALAARMMLWAADRVPATRIMVRAPQAIEGHTGSMAAVVVADQPGSSTLSWKLRDVEGRVVASGERIITLDEGENPFSFDLPYLVSGTYYADFWLQQNGTQTDWASCSVRVPHERLRGLEIEPRLLRLNQPVVGKVVLRSPLEQDESVRVMMRDADGRITQVQPLSANAGATEIPFEFSLEQARTLNMRALAEVWAGDRVLERAAHDYLYVPEASQVDFPFVLWGQNQSGILAYWAYRQYRDNVGVTAVLHWPRNDYLYLHAALNLRTQPFTYPTNVHPVGERWTRSNFPFEAWLHPEDGPAYVEEWGKIAGQIHQYGILAYSLGDEIKLGGRDVGFSDWWMPAFREHLRDVYDSLEALNSEWGSAFSSWDEVKPRKSSQVVSKRQVEVRAQENDHSWEVAEEGAPQETQPSLAPYLDHRLWVEAEFGGLLRVLNEEIRQIDPGGRLGFEGAGSNEPYYGINPYVVANNTGFWAPYRTPHVNENLRSFGSRDLITGNWWGGYVGQRRRDPRYPRHLLWQMLVDGLNSLWWFTTAGAEGGLNADLSIADFVPIEDLRYVMDGLGEWLARADFVDDPVALYYSRPSAYVCGFEEEWDFDKGLWNAWNELLWDQGFQPHTVAREEILAGELSRYHVLILPHTTAMSQEEAWIVAAFARRGGAGHRRHAPRNCQRARHLPGARST